MYLGPDHRDRQAHVLAQPPESLAVALTHDDRAHEDFDRSNVPQGDLSLCSGCQLLFLRVRRARWRARSRCKDWIRTGTNLAGGLVQTELMPELFLRYGGRGINFVAEDDKRDHGKRLDRHCGECQPEHSTSREREERGIDVHNESSSALLSANRSWSALSTKNTIPSTSGK